MVLRDLVKALYGDDLFVTSQQPLTKMGGGMEEDRAEFSRVIVLDKPAVRVTVFCFAILLFTTLRSNLLNAPPTGRTPEDSEYA
jgi:hypothetical protein